MTSKPLPGVRLYNIILAFQHFAGKPLKCTDAADALAPEAYDRMESALLTLAAEFAKQDANKWPELHKLSKQIIDQIAA